MIRLNIKRFSGGHYDYLYQKIDIYAYDEELTEMLQDLAKVLHDLEWWQSGDICEEYDKEVNRLFQENKKIKERINKAIHRIQLLQMDNNVSIRDLGLIARDLEKGGGINDKN